MSNLPPSGEIPRGAIRFNTDSNKPELWDGSQWAEFQLSTPNLGRSVDTQPGARGIFAGGFPNTNTIDYVNISSTGNAADFGDLTVPRHGLNSGSCSSSTRGLIVAGINGPTVTDTIDFVTIASTGNATDFGNIDTARRQTSSVSNQTRGIFGGGTPTSKNQLEYATIASTGNSVDFGNLTINRDGAAGLSSPTRGFFACGINDTPTPTNEKSIDFITIASLGNAQDFGDMTAARHVVAGTSNPTRGICAGGLDPSGIDVIDYFDFSSMGNSADFGNLSGTRRSCNGSASPTRAVFGGGSSPTNIIEYVIISIQSNAVDFGDLTESRFEHTAFSNAHGGL